MLYFRIMIRFMTRFLQFCVETRAIWNSKESIDVRKCNSGRFVLEKKHEAIINSRGALLKNIDLSETRNVEFVMHQV